MFYIRGLQGHNTRVRCLSRRAAINTSKTTRKHRQFASLGTPFQPAHELLQFQPAQSVSTRPSCGEPYIEMVSTILCSVIIRFTIITTYIHVYNSVLIEFPVLGRCTARTGVGRTAIA